MLTVRPGVRRGRRFARAVIVPLTAALTVALACRPTPPFAASARRPETGAVDVGRLQVLMVNGGGSKSQNYQSHLLHLRGLYDVLRRAGVPEGLISLYVSDGSDPTPDVALRDAQPEADFWLLEGTPLEGPLRTPVTYENSVVPGATLGAATRAGLQQWFDTTGRTLRPGDTLLLYVTDHGTRNAEDPANNAITLWGDGERLPVKELAAMLDTVDPGVRVVTVMSQCFSGGFAELARLRSTGPLPDGSTCGYFSSTADRPAYGCYPENRGRDNVGHSFHFIEALAEGGELAGAHDAVLVRDATPDVPLRTSDVFLQDLLRRATPRKQDQATFTDDLLRQAWTRPEAWEPELRLVDRIGQAYGLAGPRSLRELDHQAGRIPDLAAQLRTQHKAWQGALEALTRANLQRFLTGEPEWKARTEPQTLQALAPDAARDLTDDLLDDLGPATRARPRTDARLTTLRERAGGSGEVAYRMEVRDAVRLRLKTLLTTVAGRTYLAAHGTAGEQAAYEALRRCEAMAIPPVPLPPELQLAPPEPFPSFDQDLTVAARVTPAWMGIQFRQAPEGARAKAQLTPGAASVVAVYDGSPARNAGLRPGDLVLGPPGEHFEERDQIREWTMLSAVDHPAPLDVLRDGHPLRVTLTPKPYPQQWPSLPGPPKVGTRAPPLTLGQYRGTPPRALAGGKPHLVFFWATWCAVCKSALPEIAAYEKARGVRVVAVTDEEPSRLDAYFATHAGPFPSLVATDENRQAFVAYAVSGMPTFVLVDGKGIVRSYATGYSAAKGLGLDGWRWAARPKTKPG